MTAISAVAPNQLRWEPRFNQTSAAPADQAFTALPQPSETQAPAAGGQTALFGHVSLSLYYGVEESLTRQGVVNTADGGQASVRQELYRRFEAGLNLDFSFLKVFEGAEAKMASLDPSVFAKWSQTAADLMNLKEEDFEEFVKATDELFNEIEKALGMGPEGLDHIAGFFSGEVDRFLDDVRANAEYFKNNPLGEGEDMGLGVPALLERAKAGIPDRLREFLDGQMAQIAQSGQEQDGALFELLKQLKERLDEWIAGLKEGKEDETPPPAPEKTSPQPMREFSFQMSFESVSVTRAVMEYLNDAASPESLDTPDSPLDVTA